MEQLKTFHTYTSAIEVEQIAALLNQNGIPTEIILAAPQYATYVTGGFTQQVYSLKIPAGSFADANKILLQEEPVDLSLVDDTNPLLSMTNDELQEILEQPDKWGAYNYQVAILVMQGRGVNISNAELESIKADRSNKLAQPKIISPIYILGAYAAGCIPLFVYLTGNNSRFNSAIWGFIWALGLIAGFIITGTKTKLPDETVTFTYSLHSRRQGRFVIIIYVVVILITIILSALNLSGGGFSPWFKP